MYINVYNTISSAYIYIYICKNILRYLNVYININELKNYIIHIYIYIYNEERYRERDMNMNEYKCI